MMTLQEIADLLGAPISPQHASYQIRGIASLAEAECGDLSFFVDKRHRKALAATRASAVLVPQNGEDSASAVLLRVENPANAFQRIAEHFAPKPISFDSGIHPTAVIDPTATIDPTASIQPYAVIEANAKIGANTVIGAHAYIGHGATIGSHCHLYPHVIVRERCQIADRVIIHCGAVIGSDGFGFELQDGQHKKIPQTGTVQIDQDVEIGANTAIDRARFGKTWIQQGAKIDNLVQVGHNVRIGPHAILCGQVGIAGSSQIGAYTVLAGQVGVTGHVIVGDQVVSTAQSGITKNIPDKSVISGSPAKPINKYKEDIARVSRLKKLSDRVTNLEKNLHS